MAEGPHARRQVGALLSAWLVVDLWAGARRRGGGGSATLTTTIFAQGFLAYLFAALSWQDSNAVAYLAGNLAFVGALVLLSLLGGLGRELRHPADRDLVRTSPIGAPTYFVARALHSVLWLGLQAVGLALPAAVLACWTLDTVLAFPLFLAMALLVSALLVGLQLVPILAVDRLLGEHAAVGLATLLRTLLLGASFFGLALGLRAMLRGPEAFPGGIDLLRWLPPLWFAEAALELLGLRAGGDGLLLAGASLAGTALLAFGLAVLPRRPLAARPRRRGDPLPLRLARPWLGSPAERGGVAFVLAMLARERSFRLRALPLLGLPLGMIFFAEKDAHGLFFAMAHSLPIAFVPFLLHSLPFAEQHRANWVLAEAPLEPVATSRRAVALAFAALVVPAQLLLLALDAWERGLGPALPTTMAATGLAWLLLPRFARSLDQPVFSQDPDSFRTPPSLNGDLGVGLVVSALAIAAELALGKRPAPWTALAAVLLVVGFLALRPRRGGLR
ncbi:MAG: hypothetical protein R3F30_00345 [Planctomycetota bacterium]